MKLSPVRLFGAGVLVVFALATTFVVGITVGHEAPRFEAIDNRGEPIEQAGTVLCPPHPGSGAEPEWIARAADCADAVAIQSMLAEAGAPGAHVNVRTQDPREARAVARVRNVTVQVFLPEAMREVWDAEAAARLVARRARTPVDRVKVLDESLQPLFDGGKAAPARSIAPTGATPSRPPR